MKEAVLYEKLDGNKVRCNLCAHRCVIHPGHAGICKVRENRGGKLYTKVYGRAIARHIDPIEKKPLYHFYPGSNAYSFATPGCNFHCQFCQNYDISQVTSEEILEMGERTTPGQIVQDARYAGCKSIAHTYTEPVIFFEYGYDVAVLAHKEGLQNIYVSNGYMTFEMLDRIEPYLDAINVDLKAFRDKTYRKIIGGRLQPVLDNLKRIKQMGIWLEVTSLIIPGVNDDPGEIRDMAGFIAAELGKDVPWHISRFFPAWKMNEVPPTPLETLQMAETAGFDAGLNYVYIGNVATGKEITRCPRCGHALIERLHFGIITNRIKGGQCPACGMKIAGVGLG
jgi:pyruvate formate lyase activating enzyme